MYLQQDSKCCGNCGNQEYEHVQTVYLTGTFSIAVEVDGSCNIAEAKQLARGNAFKLEKAFEDTDLSPNDGSVSLKAYNLDMDGIEVL